MAKNTMNVDEENAEKKKFHGVLKSDIESGASAINKAKTKSSEASGDLSAKLEIFEGKGGMKKALKEATRVKNMEPDERADYIRARNAYEEALGCYDQLDLIDAIETQEQEQQKNGDSISAANAAAAKTSKPALVQTAAHEHYAQ